ncbi:MAG: IS66 family insertion sequence element accessory protein TnpA [Vibrio ordalii]|uniref:IS66 family insertion sequence element accessory protein TnpA n=1 Tax=Vibrio ordalii TaxID=28174 RepID=UPI003F40A347
MSYSQHWQQHIDAWQQSGGAQAQYCRQHELDQSQFSYWKRKLTKNNDTKPVRPSRFAVAQVAVMPEPPSSLSISLPNGIVLGGIDAMNASVAAQLLEYLR